MKKANVFKMCCAAVFAALIFISVYAVPIPLPGNGYFNLGDCFIIVAALCIGPFWGGLSGAVGAGLSDLLLGYTYYAPATFVIKWLMAAVAYGAYRSLKKVLKLKISAVAVSAFAAEVIMVLGYFAFEIPLYGIAVATADVLGNAVQGICGMIAGTLLYSVLSETGIKKKIFKDI